MPEVLTETDRLPAETGLSGSEPAGACCPPRPACLPAALTGERPGLRVWPFVSDWLETPAGTVPQVATRLAVRDSFGRWQMRWGLGRRRYRIPPGLYAVGTPHDGSPVLVTANYKLSFDALRCRLAGLHLWILVLETEGINVWCAAGKGTFGTTEVVRQVRGTALERVVSHRVLVLPQLGAPGVAAHLVERQTGFRVIYGPVRAADVAVFLAAGMKATPAMRRVTFTLGERLVLTPVELTGMARQIGWSCLGLLAIGALGPQFFHPAAALLRGGLAIAVGLTGVVAGAVLTPILLPWLPGRAFAVKGAELGAMLAVVGLLLARGTLGFWNGAALLLALPAVASWCAMNFTGSTTYTSPSGVEKEMRRAIPFQGGALLIAAVAWVFGGFVGG